MLFAVALGVADLPAAATVAVKPGDGPVTAITDGVAINDQGLIAFPGSTSAGSQIFLFRPSTSTIQTFGLTPNSSRTYGGVGISSGNNPLIIAREQVTGPTFVVRTWDSGPAGTSTILGSSVASSGPKDFDSATSFVDLSNTAIATIPALIGGSTATALMIGPTRPLAQVATYSGAVAIRPQIADTGEVVIRDNTGRIVAWTPASAVTVVAGSSLGFGTDTGNRPGISRDGSAIAFSGNRGAGAGIYLYIRPGSGTPYLSPIAGGELADGFSNFVSESRVGVAVSHFTDADFVSVVFQARLGGIDGVFARTATLGSDGVVARSEPLRLAKVGDALLGSTITGFGLHRPINESGAIAFTARLADLRTVILSSGLLHGRVRNVENTADVLPEIEPSNLRIPVKEAPPGVFTRRRNRVGLQLYGPADTELRLFIQPDASSGGHDHHPANSAENRPHGWLSAAPLNPDFPSYFGAADFESGGTLKYRNAEDTGANAFKITTGADGRAFVYYTAPEISGNETIWFQTFAADGSTRSEGRIEMTVSTPGLEDFPASPDVALVGNESSTQHFNNHWCTPALRLALQRLAQNYAVQRPRGKVPNHPLALNDLSLAEGGFFDADGDWNVEGAKAHKGHRLGFEADVGGSTKGFGLVPGNAVFDLLVQDQGCFYSAHESGNHYHLIHYRAGRVSIIFVDPGTASWIDFAARTLRVRIPYENCGGVPANAVTISALSASGGVAVLNPLPLPLGAAAIRAVGDATKELVVDVQVPPGVRRFTISGRGSATSGEVGGTFPVPAITRGASFARVIAVPPAPGAGERSPPVATSGSWSLTVTNADTPITPGTTVVYQGVISNRTGAEIDFDLGDLSFVMGAAEGSYTFEYAPELLETGGIVPVAGYAGPLFLVHWIAAPPPASRGAISFSLQAAPTAGLPDLATEVGVEHQPQNLSIEKVGDQIILSWSTAASGMVLEWASSLGGEVEWLDVEEPRQVIDGRYVVVVPAGSNATRYFRLRSPF